MNIQEFKEEILSSEGVLHWNPKKPFTLSSGKMSPLYFDSRAILKSPKHKKMVIKAFKELLEKDVIYRKKTIIAGVPKAGLLFSSSLADLMELPEAYVGNSGKQKAYGTEKFIEGTNPTGKNIFLVEDVLSTGKSAINDALAFKKVGADSVRIISIFSGRSSLKNENFSKVNFHYQALLGIEDIVNFLEMKLSSTDCNLLKKWVSGDHEWGFFMRQVV